MSNTTNVNAVGTASAISDSIVATEESKEGREAIQKAVSDEKMWCFGCFATFENLTNTPDNIRFSSKKFAYIMTSYDCQSVASSEYGMVFCYSCILQRTGSTGALIKSVNEGEVSLIKYGVKPIHPFVMLTPAFQAGVHESYNEMKENFFTTLKYTKATLAMMARYLSSMEENDEKKKLKKEIEDELREFHVVKKELFKLKTKRGSGIEKTEEMKKVRMNRSL